MARTRGRARNAASVSLSLKLGKYGAFVGCSNYPECGYTRQLGDANGNGDGQDGMSGDRALGKDPYTNEEIVLKSAASAPTSSAARARKPSAPACRRAGRRTRSITRRRWRFCRCRATSANIRRAAR
jgi:topoisomerase IA-like protein